MLEFAKTPPKGWNSWDVYGASVTEEEVKRNADIMAEKLKVYGWDYVVVDIQWYEPGAESAAYRKFADLKMDEYSRVLPAENRFPSSADGAGFAPLAEYVHKLGLKFGIHILRGIPRQAVHGRMHIKGTDKTADQIAVNSICPWNSDMYGVDMSIPEGQLYYDSLMELYASWGVDFIKVDDIAYSTIYRDSHRKEIEGIRKAIDKTGREIVLSLSPGPARLQDGSFLQKNANMWRLTDDFWDEWELLYDMFDRCNYWSPFIRKGNWPDCDMLPLGHIGIRSGERGKADRMATMMTKDQYQRTLLNIFRQLFAQIASLLVTAGTLPLVDFITEYVGARKAWSIVYGIFGVIAAILFFLCFAGCKERIHENEETKTEKIRVVDGVKAVLKNKYWHMLMVISICINIFFQAISTVNTYYSKAVLHNSSMISILNTAYIVPAIATFFFVHLVVKKYGKGKTTMFGWMIICVSYVILLPFTENTTVLIITAAMRGVGYCFLLAVSSAMVSDAVEYGEWKTKIRVEGLTFSMQGFVGTIAAGIVTAVIGWVLNFSKYDGTLSFADTQAGSAVLAIKLLFIAVPFVVGVLNIILLKFYKLDKMYPQIIEDLNKRNGK